MKRATVLILFLLSALAAFAAPAASSVQQARRGLVTDLPFETKARDFSFQIWFTGDSEERGKLQVFLYNNPNLRFQPSLIELERNKPVSITATRNKASSASLVEIIARPQSPGWEGIDQTVNFGFSGSLKTDLPQSLKGGEKRAFSVEIVDGEGKPVTLTAPAFVRLIGSNAKLRQGSEWVSKLDIPLQTGANATPLVEIVAEKIPWGGQGSVQADLHTAEQYVLTNSSPRSFNIPVATWMQYGMAVVGGLLNVVYSLLLIVSKLGTETKARVWAKAGMGALGGVVAVLFADKLSLIGVQIEQVSVAGYVTMGFLISYVGIEALLAKLKPLEAMAGTGTTQGEQTGKTGETRATAISKSEAGQGAEEIPRRTAEQAGEVPQEKSEEQKARKAAA